MKVDHLAAILRALAEVPNDLAVIRRRLTQSCDLAEATRNALPPLLVTTREGARICRVSEGTMRQWIKTGAIPSVKIENTTRIDLTFFGSHKINGRGHEEARPRTTAEATERT